MPLPPTPEEVLATAPITLALEPAHNALKSLALLNRADQLSGLNPWITETAAALTPEQRHRNRLVITGLHHAVLPLESWPTFPAYLDALASTDPLRLRERLLRELCAILARETPLDDVPTADWLLADVDHYLTALRDYFPGPFDPDLEAEAHAYLQDPPAMRALIVDHLGQMWQDFLAAEWERTRPMLQEAVAAFGELDYSGLTPYEAAQRITGNDLPGKWQDILAGYRRVIFVPSPHIGPYAGKFQAGETLWLFFGARHPAGSHARSMDLNRSELLVRLNALADDTRLRILALVRQEGELCAQDIITRLALSQSAASRHLRQLSASGHLTERRHEGAKCYRLNPDRIHDTIHALKSFLLK